MTLDLTPILSTLIQLAALALMALGGWAIQRLAVKLGLDAHSAMVAQLDDALDKSIAAGAMTATAQIRTQGWDHPEVKNQVVAAAGQYLLRQWPDLVRRLGLDPAASEPMARLAPLLDRAYPTAMAPIAASPVTPPTAEAVLPRKMEP